MLTTVAAQDWKTKPPTAADWTALSKLPDLTGVWEAPRGGSPAPPAPQLTPAAIDAIYQEQRRDLDGTRLRVSHVLLRPDVVDASGVERRIAEADAIRRDIRGQLA